MQRRNFSREFKLEAVKLVRERLGQRGSGELLLIDEDRTDRPEDISNAHHAKADVFDYIERFYNQTRRHSMLGYLSSMDFERQAHVA